jgi:hypothetical protein
MTAGNPPPTFTGRLDEAGTSLKGRFAVGGMGGRFAAVKQ